MVWGDNSVCGGPCTCDEWHQEKPTMSKTSSKDALFIQSLQDDDEYTDVTFLAGMEQKPFKLHRFIICKKSSFFRAACKECFQEGRNREIYLPIIKPNTFAKVVVWIYSGGFEIPPPDHLDAKDIAETFQVADYLGLVEMRDDILAAAARFTHACHKDYVSGKRQADIPETSNLVEELSKHCSLADYDKLKAIFHPLSVNLGLANWHVQPGEEKHLLSYDKQIMTIALDSVTGLICDNICQDCRKRLDLKKAERCKCCGKTFKYLHHSKS